MPYRVVVRQPTQLVHHQPQRVRQASAQEQAERDRAYGEEQMVYPDDDEPALVTYEMNVNTRNFCTLMPLKTMVSTASVSTTLTMTMPHTGSAALCRSLSVR